jgi:branched-chain amino acid aminotransferase
LQNIYCKECIKSEFEKKLHYLLTQMDYIITNKGILSPSEMKVLQFDSDRSVYEVIRIIDGVALFIEDHFARLKTSMKISGLNLEMELDKFGQNIAKLIQLNQKLNGNVKFILSMVKNEIQWSYSFIPHSYPVAIDYQKGVSTGLLFAERENPNAKVIQNNIREIANKMIVCDNLYEVLFADRNGLITEGSRSNVFFVKSNRFYTSPASQVLVGITRQKVMECLVELGFLCIEEAVATSEINDFDAVFLTGTSPKVLPVNCIGLNQFPVNNFFVRQLISKYNSIIEKYINDRKAG